MKYGPFNWRQKKISSTVYYSAALRHLMAWYDGEDFDPDSGQHHLAHAAACCLMVLDVFETDKLNDNRPPPGTFSDLARKRASRLRLRSSRSSVRCRHDVRKANGDLRSSRSGRVDGHRAK